MIISVLSSYTKQVAMVWAVARAAKRRQWLGEEIRVLTYKFGKIKFSEFSRFFRPSNQSFPDKYKV